MQVHGGKACVRLLQEPGGARHKAGEMAARRAEIVLNMLEKKFVSKIVKKILEKFPNAMSVVLHSGAAGDDFSPRINDVDLLIVLDGMESTKQIQKKLKYMCKEFRDELELDPSVTFITGLKNGLRMITWHSSRKAHGMDMYRIKRGRIIYGKSGVLKEIPEVTIRQALLDVVPHVRDVFIRDIRKGMNKTQNIKRFVKKEADVFYVIVRTIYTIETGKIGSKKNALVYLGRKHQKTSNLAEFLLDVYSKKKSSKKVAKAEIVELLDIAENRIRNFRPK